MTILVYYNIYCNREANILNWELAILCRIIRSMSNLKMNTRYNRLHLVMANRQCGLILIIRKMITGWFEQMHKTYFSDIFCNDVSLEKILIKEIIFRNILWQLLNFILKLQAIPNHDSYKIIIFNRCICFASNNISINYWFSLFYRIGGANNSLHVFIIEILPETIRGSRLIILDLVWMVGCITSFGL